MKANPTPKTTERSDAPAPFSSDDAATSYHHFLPVVLALPEDAIEICRADPNLLRTNVWRGVSAFGRYESVIRQRMTHCPAAEYRELLPLSLGLVYAANRVAGPISDREIEANLRALRPLRATMLKQLEVLAEAKRVPLDRVKEIRRGQGPLDAANNGVAIAGMYAEFAGSIANQHPFSGEQLGELARLGNWLLAALTPSAAVATPVEKSEATAIRDRFYSEIRRRYEAMREVCVLAVGLRQLDELVPPLHSRSVTPAATQLPPGDG